MNVVWKFLVAFAAGAVLMLVISFTVYRKSYHYKKAMAEAGLGEEPGLLSRFVTAAFVLVTILFMALFDLWVAAGEARSFWFLSALNLGLVALISLFDALFIDYFLLVVWRPAILRLPEGRPTRDSMLKHIQIQFTAGWIFKIPIAVLGAALSSLLGAGIG